jgi:hypothetical protein
LAYIPSLRCNNHAFSLAAQHHSQKDDWLSIAKENELNYEQYPKTSTPMAVVKELLRNAAAILRR